MYAFHNTNFFESLELSKQCDNFPNIAAQYFTNICKNLRKLQPRKSNIKVLSDAHNSFGTLNSGLDLLFFY